MKILLLYGFPVVYLRFHTVNRREVVVHDLIVELPDGRERFAKGQLAGGRARVARGFENTATALTRTARI